MTTSTVILTLCVVMYWTNLCKVEGDTTVSGKQMEGYSGMLVMVMDGKYDMLSSNPYIPSCMQDTIYCNGVYFWKIVLHEDPAGYYRSSKRYMLHKWGLNVTSMMADGSIEMRDIYTDPRANHRAYVVPDESVHYLGWHVHNQAFQFTLQRPVRLTGSSGKGRVVPTGTSFLYGQYMIQKSTLSPDGQVENLDDYYRLKYESSHAIVPRSDTMRAVVLCDVSESPWGSGVSVAASFIKASQFSNGNWFVRTVITLDGQDGLGTAPGINN